MGEDRGPHVKYPKVPPSWLSSSFLSVYCPCCVGVCERSNSAHSQGHSRGEAETVVARALANNSPRGGVRALCLSFLFFSFLDSEIDFICLWLSFLFFLVIYFFPFFLIIHFFLSPINGKYPPFEACLS